MITNFVVRKAVQVGTFAVQTSGAVLGRVAGAFGKKDQPSQAPTSRSEPRTSSTPPVEVDEREQIVEAIREEQADVGELADPDLDVAEVQAQLRAKHLIEERAEQAKQRTRR